MKNISCIRKPQVISGGGGEGGEGLRTPCTLPQDPPLLSLNILWTEKSEIFSIKTEENLFITSGFFVYVLFPAISGNICGRKINVRKAHKNKTSAIYSHHPLIYTYVYVRMTYSLTVFGIFALQVIPENFKGYNRASADVK